MSGPGDAHRPARQPAGRLRADACRNRAALIGAAREVFAEEGLDAPLEEIARRAGVGIATLYRRFPSRQHLVAAALADKISDYAGAAERALAEPDPWTGFEGFVRWICAAQADDRGLGDLLLITLAPGAEIEATRARANRAALKIIERAKADGTLRDDMTGEDLLLMLLASGAVTSATRQDAARAVPRFVALMLDAFRPGAGTVLPPAPSSAQMRRVMRRLADEHGCG
jgi:AcrR family transcriptional regulator